MADLHGDGSTVDTPVLYKYTVLDGNESVLMREALERRPWWAAAAEGQPWQLWWGGNGQKFDWMLMRKGKRGTMRPSMRAWVHGLMRAMPSRRLSR